MSDSEDLTAFVKAMDRCWMERRFEDLAAFFAPEIAIVAASGAHRATGAAAAIESYRGFMSRAEVHAFESSDHTVTRAGDTAVVEYMWIMRWRDGGAEHDAQGREVLALARLDGSWRVIWRMQLAA